MHIIRLMAFAIISIMTIACADAPKATDNQTVESVAAAANTVVTEKNLAEAKNEEVAKESPAAEVAKVEAIKEPSPTKVEVVKEKINTAPKTAATKKDPIKEVITKPLAEKEAVKVEVIPVKVETPTPATPKTETPVKTEGEKKVEEKKEEVAPAPPAKPVFSHDTWNGLLQKHVSNSGKVNYAGFKADKAKLDSYLKSLSDNPIQSAWSSNKKLAYWINAYNAFTVKLIVDNYPVASITDLHGGKPWDQKWIKLAGKTYSLNNIENDIIRPTFKEPRIHFAVNCAAKSCPPILNKAWTEGNLKSLLAQQAKKFINDSNFNIISAKKIQVSKIFEWYGGDFGDLITYLNKYANTKIDSGAKVEFKEYDWALNK